MRDYGELASRYLLQHKRRSTLTIVGIVLAVSLFSSISTLFLSYRDLQIQDVKKTNGNYDFSYKEINEVQLDSIINNVEVLNYGVMKELGTVQIAGNNKQTKGKKPFSINIKSYDNEAFNNIFNNYFHLKEGRLPAKEDEIVVEARLLYSLGDKKVGDSISLITSKKGNGKTENNIKKYVIVGTYEEGMFSSDTYNGFTYLQHYDLNNKGMYNVFVNLKEKKDKIGIASNIAKDLNLNTSSEKSQFSINMELLTLESFTLHNILDNKIANQIALLFCIIVVCGVAIVYNNFNIAVMERMEQFGVMRTIGATPKQIRKLVFREAFYMCIIAIPIGLVTGYLGLYSILEILRKIINVDYTIIHVKFYPLSLLICIFLITITVLISVWSPARRAGKVSAIDAVKTTTVIKNERIRRRKGKAFRILFKFEGEMAYKNVRRIPKRFWITVSSLVISMTLLIVYGTYTKNVYKSNNMQHSLSEADARFEKIEGTFTEGDYKEITSMEGIDRIYKVANNPTEIIFPKKYGNLNYEKETGNPLMVVKGFENYIYAGNSIMSYYDDNAFQVAKKYLVDGVIDKSLLNNMGVILVRKGDNDYSNYKVGDKISIPKIKSYQWGEVEQKYKKGEISDKDLEAYNMKTAIKNNEFYSLNIVGIVSNDFLNEHYALQDGLNLIFTEEVYKKLNGNLDSEAMLIKFKDKQSREKLNNYFSKKASELGGRYIDYYKKAEEERNRILQEKVFIYGIIALISLISSINIINSIGINILIRKKEFAALQAVGMTRGQMTRMVLLEGLIHGVIAAFVSLILGSYVIRIIMKGEGREITSNIPIEILIISIGGGILISLFASFIPLRRLKNLNIVENLKSE